MRVAPEILAKYVGSYKTLDIWNGEPLPRFIEITVSDGALFAAVKGGERVQLMAKSETTFSGFFGRGIRFLLDSQGAVTYLVEQHISGEYRFIPVK